jgi:hypothetical protein
MVHNQLVHNNPPTEIAKFSMLDFFGRFDFSILLGSYSAVKEFQSRDVRFRGTLQGKFMVFCNKRIWHLSWGFLWPIFPSSYLGITQILILGIHIFIRYPMISIICSRNFQVPHVVSCKCFLSLLPHNFPCPWHLLIHFGQICRPLNALDVCCLDSNSDNEKCSWRKGNEQLSLFCLGVL